MKILHLEELELGGHFASYMSAHITFRMDHIIFMKPCYDDSTYFMRSSHKMLFSLWAFFIFETIAMVFLKFLLESTPKVVKRI